MPAQNTVKMAKRKVLEICGFFFFKFSNFIKWSGKLEILKKSGILKLYSVQTKEKIEKI